MDHDVSQKKTFEFLDRDLKALDPRKLLRSVVHTSEIQIPASPTLRRRVTNERKNQLTVRTHLPLSTTPQIRVCVL